MTNENVGMYHGASAPTAANHGASALPANDYSASAPTLPDRKRLRAEFHDYSGGEYFITICTRDKEHYFGEIKDGVMHFSEIGAQADKLLRELPTHHKYADAPLFVVMPNHIHAIIDIFEPTASPQTVAGIADTPSSTPTERTALSVIVGGFKQAVTMYARRNNIDFGWQKRFHDHIIRGVRDGNMIANYIENNVANWTSDCFYPKPENQ